MSTQTRLSPGIELREIDRSSYSQYYDNSIVGTTVLIPGFSDKGEDYTVQRIMSTNHFIDQYGIPTNEIETYMYLGVLEVLSRGGIAAAVKLPYDNISKDHFTATSYDISLNSNDKYSVDLSKLDNTIDRESQLNFLSINNVLVDEENPGTYDHNEIISMEEFDQMRVSNSIIKTNRIKIIDITRGQYDKINAIIEDDKGGTEEGATTVEKSSDSQECEMIGIMPVITTALNSMYYNNIFMDDESINNTNEIHKKYIPISKIKNRYVSESVYKKFTEDDIIKNCVIPVSTSSIFDESVSSQASKGFPYIGYKDINVLDRKYFKYICVSVFKVFKDKSNDDKINFELVEQHVGSLDRKSKNSVTNASDYIGDVVNANSQYINLFANIKIDNDYNNAITCIVNDDYATVLGFTEEECKKIINKQRSILDPLTYILDKIKDTNQYRIDIIADSGISNIAAYSNRNTTLGSDIIVENAILYPYYLTKTGDDLHQDSWSFNRNDHDISSWRAVQKKFDDFCKYERQDCVFITDIYRPLVLESNEKRVRPTLRSKSIENTIIKDIKYVSGLNSSYTIGYSNWFFVENPLTGEFIWCPPSIKAAGVYIYTDAYAHTWDAPAGLRRGRILGAVDISFNPHNDEAGKLYQSSWNYAVSYPQNGIILEGQKTFQTELTALDRVNVRRLMIWIERNVIAIARRFLYEGNTPFMRQRFFDMVQPIFEEAKTGNGISNYAIRCDETLNTSEVIDRNEFRCVCAVVPVKSIEFIKMNFIISNQSANVNEEVVKNI